jgi:hypothetical protein
MKKGLTVDRSCQERAEVNAVALLTFVMNEGLIVEKRGSVQNETQKLALRLPSSLYFIMRQLSLHASALNDAEYDLYTTSLANLDDSEQDAPSTSRNTTHDDAYYERMKIGVREARGWIRGRYPNVSPANIDTVCLVLHSSLILDSALVDQCNIIL